MSGRRTMLVALAACAVTAFLPVRSHATITPRAQELVDRYVAATGGADVLARQRSVRVKGHIKTMSLQGTFDRRAAMPDRVYTRYALGTLRYVEGFDGTTGWRTDLNSKQVTLLDGPELARMRADAYFENEMWARPGQGGGTVTDGMPVYRGAEEFRPIEITPPAGRSRKIWISTKTGLALRTLERGDGNREHSIWYTAWRTLAGRERPGVESMWDPDLHITWDVHGDPDAEQAFIDSAWVNKVDSTVFAPPHSRTGSTTWAKARGVARVPFKFGRSHVWVRASINGAPPADFILDTGASSTALDAAYAEEIGLVHEGEFAVQGMGGTGGASFARLRSVRVGDGTDGVTTTDLRAVLIDLDEGSRPFLWRRMCGLIGYDFLSRFVTTIDFDRQVVTFRDPKTFTYDGHGVALDVKYDSGCPVVPVRLDSLCQGDFIVDVGNAMGTVLHGSMVRRCGLLQEFEKRKQLKMYGGGVGAGFASWMTRVDSLAIGPVVIGDPIVGLTLGTRGMVGSTDIAGNIGCSVLRRFTCTFDYERRKLYLEPGKRFAEPEHASRIGAAFARFQHRVVAAGVMHGSPADEAGLQRNDEILSIDGRPILSYSAEEMDALFEEGAPGGKHTIEIRRERVGQKQLKLVLREML